MQIEKKKIKDMNRALYNPRVELTPKDIEYQNLRQSINTYGMLIPVVWNKRTNTIISGHQRLSVLENEGETEVEVSVVDIDEKQEKQLNIALNKIEGDWEEEKLTELFTELGEEEIFTGFTQQEIDNIKNDIDSMIDNDILEKELKEIEEFFNVTLTFDKSVKEDLKTYMKEYGKEALVQVIIRKAKEEI